MGGAYNKTLVSALMSLLILIDQWWGISIGWLTEEWLTSLLAIISPILVYYTRNHA